MIGRDFCCRMGFLVTWLQHLNRRLVGVQRSLTEKLCAQRIDQQLKMNTASSAVPTLGIHYARYSRAG